eukprot:9539709-Karenia_brevis.AAC.1
MLEFLRKTGDDGTGKIVQWLARKYLQWLWAQAHSEYMKTARRKLRGVRAFREAIGREYRAQASAQA